MAEFGQKQSLQSWIVDAQKLMSESVDFFDRQFSAQVREGAHELNPFELMSQPYLTGDVLDFGCGLGNLSIVAAESGCRVLALDAAPAAITHLQNVAARRSLPLTAVQADLRSYHIDASYDGVVSIGLLMFFAQPTALAQLDHLISSVRPRGIAAVNVLIEGTSFLDMFGGDSYYLFGRDELKFAFKEWNVLLESYDDFSAPRGTVKRFATVIARRPN